MKKQRLAALFLVGFLLLNYPVFSLFDRSFLILQIPLLYFYVFLVWICIILFAWLIIQTPNGNIEVKK